MIALSSMSFTSAPLRRRSGETLTNGEFTQQVWGGRRIGSDWNVGSPVKRFK
jgi:hypothetical protein